METFARIIYNINTHTVLHVAEHTDKGVTSFNILDTDIGHCSTLHPILVAQGYNVDVLEAYMNDKNIAIPE